MTERVLPRESCRLVAGGRWVLNGKWRLRKQTGFCFIRGDSAREGEKSSSAIGAGWSPGNSCLATGVLLLEMQRDFRGRACPRTKPPHGRGAGGRSGNRRVCPSAESAGRGKKGKSAFRACSLLPRLRQGSGSAWQSPTSVWTTGGLTR